jgi:hypothetical protein
MLQTLLNFYEAAQSIPIHVSVPILVFVLGVIFVFSLLMLGSKGHLQTEKEFGFAVGARPIYQIPRNYSTMQPSEKRRVTIQNLYLNHSWDLDGIARLLELDQVFVKDVLAKSGHLRRN